VDRSPGDIVLRRCAVSKIALVLSAAVLTLGAAGCKNSAQVFQDNNEGGWFSKPLDVFAKPTWASAAPEDKIISLGPKGPVGPDELVAADGRCGVPAAPVVEAAPTASAAATPAPPADRPVGSMAGDLARAPMPAATPVSVTPNAAPPEQPPGAPTVMGGIALGMTECDVVRRAGQAGQVNITAGDKGGRKVVLTYLTGTWPGIYTFDAGRLKEVSRAPVPPPAAKPAVRKNKAKKPVKPKTAANPPVERAFVQ